MAGRDELVREFSAKLECSVCGDIFIKPKTLPCFHNFCEHCIKSWWRKCEEEHKPFTCPDCRSVVELSNGDLSGLRSSFYVAGLLELYEVFKTLSSRQESPMKVCGDCEKAGAVSAFCSDCSDLLCVQCEELHRRMKATRNHRIILLEEFQSKDVQEFLQRPTFCTEENHEHNRLEYYCKTETCRKCVCQKCVSLKDKHKEHDYTSMEKAAAEAKAAMIEQAERVKKAITYYEDIVARSHDKLAYIERQMNSARREVHESVDAAIHKFRKHEAEVMVKIDKVQNKQETLHRALQKDLELQIVQLTSYVEYVEGMANRNLKTEILHGQSTAAQRGSELLDKHANQTQPSPDSLTVSYKTKDNFDATIVQALGELVIINHEVDPGRCEVEIQMITSGVHLRILTRNRMGELCYCPEGSLFVKVEGRMVGQRNEMNIVYNEKKNGNNIGRYTPRWDGENRITVRFEGQKITEKTVYITAMEILLYQ